MDAIEALKTRRSVRTYTAQPVPREILEEVIDCARLSASANNLQPWEFVVVTDVAARQRIAGMATHGRFIASAPVCVAVFCNDTKYYLEDGSAASENLLLAAHALGLGACWVAGDKKDYCEPIREMLGLPEGMKLISLISVGYPTPQLAPAKEKRPLSSVLHWEKY